MGKEKEIRVTFGKKSTDSKILILLFVIFDLMFLPYIRALHCSAGMLIVGLWYMFNFMKKGKEYIWIFILCVVLSNVVGIFTRSIRTYGVTQGIMVVYMFLLIEFLEGSIPEKSSAIRKLLIYYTLFTTALAVVYATFPQEYFSLRSAWTMSNTQIEFTEMSINRFTSIFSDPNNAGTALIAILAYILVYEDVKMYTLTLVCACIFMCIVLTYSVTALILFISVILVYLILGNKTAEQKKKSTMLLLIVCIATIVCGEFIFAASSGYSSNVFIRTLQKRIEWNTSGNSLGGRIPRWKELITTLPIWEYIVVGKGLVLDSRGRMFQAHNGILLLLYSYGLPALILYFKRFYSFAQKKIIYLLPVIVIFVGVFINEGFGDYRFLTITTLIIALVKNKTSLIAKKESESGTR